MPSILETLRNCIPTRDPSRALFSAGVKAWKQYEEMCQLRYLKEAVQNHQAALDVHISGHPLRSKSLFNTAMVLWAHCQGAVTKESSSTVIAYYNEALLLFSGKLGRRATIYANCKSIQ